MTKNVAILAIVCGQFCLTMAEAEASDRPDDSAVARQIDDLLGRVYPSHEPGAVVIVVKNGNVVFRKAYGLADVQAKVTMTPEMNCPIGSVSKPFTAMAIMILAEQEKLALDDPITKFLRECPAHWNRISIRHLLTHSSGIRRLHSMKEYWDHIREDMSPDELITMFRDEPPEFAPGDKHGYCNSGYYLLGKIVETVSGQPYEQFVREQILKPLNMSNTSFARNTQPTDNRVRGYQKRGDSFVKAPSMSYSHLYAGGDIITNVDDLTKWDEAMYGKKLISHAGLKQLFTPFALNNGKSSGVAMSWFIDELKGRKCVYHGGGIFGYVAHTIRLPEERVYVALLSNRVDRNARPSTQGVAEMVAAIAVGEPFDNRQRKAIRLSSNELVNYAGVYRSSDVTGGTLVANILVEDGSVFYVSSNRKTQILPESKTKFFIDGKLSILTFEFENGGRAVRMVLHIGGEGGRRLDFVREQSRDHLEN